ELDIMVSLSDGTQRRMESLSPGEQTRVSLSNLFAMIEVFNAIHPGLVTWIALDEPFVHLDDSAIPVAMHILHDAVERVEVEMVTLTDLCGMIEGGHAIHPVRVTAFSLDDPVVHLDDSAIPVAMNILHDAVERGVVDMVLITSHQKQVIDSAKQEVKVGVGVE